MKQFLYLASLFLAIALHCSAGPCGTAPLASYIALGSGGCTIGTNTLFDFQTLTGTSGAVAISPATITIAPLGGTLNPGISATINMTANAGVQLEALFTYTITGNPFIGDSITLTNSSETGDGAVTDIQNFCAGGAFGPDGVTGCSGFAGSLLTLDGLQNHDSTSLNFATLLNVTDDFTLDGGLAGSASGGTITDRFAAVPEPSSLLVAGLGLLLAVGLKLRFWRV